MNGTLASEKISSSDGQTQRSWKTPFDLYWWKTVSQAKIAGSRMRRLRDDKIFGTSVSELV